MEEEVQLIFSGIRYHKTKIQAITDDITKAGTAYAKRLHILQKEIRSHKGFEDFAYKATDIDGIVWENAIK